MSETVTDPTADPIGNAAGPDPTTPVQSEQWELTRDDLRDLGEIAAQGSDAAALVREHWRASAIQPSELNRRNGAATAMAQAVRLLRPIAAGAITTRWTTTRDDNGGIPVTWVWMHIPLRTMRIALMERLADVAHYDPRTDEWVYAPVLIEALHQGAVAAVEITAELPMVTAQSEWNRLSATVEAPQHYALHAAMGEANNRHVEGSPDWYAEAVAAFHRIIAGNGNGAHQ